MTRRSDYNELTTPIDRVSKLLFKAYPDVLVSLAFPNQTVEVVRVEENVEINLPTRPVDLVMTIRCLETNGDWVEKALHLEHYGQYAPSQARTVFIYSAELTDRMQMDVVTAVLYTGRVPKVRPSSTYTVTSGDQIMNEFRFVTIWLADYEDEIRSGQLAPLAPFLLEIVQRPTHETIETARELALTEPDMEQKSLLLSLVALLAGRYYDKEYIRQLFKKDVEMMQTNTFFDDWWLEAEVRGEQRGEIRGEVRAKIQLLRRMIARRFGYLPPKIEGDLEEMDQEELDTLFDFMDQGVVEPAEIKQKIETLVAGG